MDSMDPQKRAVKRLFGVLHAVLVICGNPTVAQLTFQFEASGCHYEGESLVLVAEYNGSKSVNTLDWYYSGKVAANIIIIASGCTQFGGADAGYPSSRMSYSCDTGANIYKATISNLAKEDEGEWGVFLTLDDFSTTALKKMPLGLCKKCDVGNITCGGHNITQSAVKEGTTAGIQCDEGCVFDGTKELTCQSDGTWNPPWKNCEKPCCCETIVCWILGIVAIVLIILLVVIHICFIECEVSELAITDLSCSLFGIRALLPGCCICTLTVIIHIIVYFVKLDDDDCDTVECLVLPLIVKVLSAAGGLVIIAIYVYVRAGNKGTKLQKNNTENPDKRKEPAGNKGMKLQKHNTENPDKNEESAGNKGTKLQKKNTGEESGAACFGGRVIPLCGEPDSQSVNKPGPTGADKSHPHVETKTEKGKHEKTGSAVSGGDIQLQQVNKDGRDGNAVA